VLFFRESGMRAAGLSCARAHWIGRCPVARTTGGTRPPRAGARRAGCMPAPTQCTSHTPRGHTQALSPYVLLSNSVVCIQGDASDVYSHPRTSNIVNPPPTPPPFPRYASQAAAPAYAAYTPPPPTLAAVVPAAVATHVWPPLVDTAPFIASTWEG
jgi:hypothetical protein